MSFSSIAVVVLIVCYRRSEVKARPQHEENAFVRKAASLHTRGHFDEDNLYVDSTNEKYEYHRSDPSTVKAIATATATATATSTPSAASTSLKVARDGSLRNFAPSSSYNFDSIGNLDGAASSLNGFSSGNNPPLPPAPPPPSFAFPPGGPGFEHFGASSSFGGSGGGGGGGGGSHFEGGSTNFGGGYGGDGGGGGGGGSGSSEAGYHNVQPVIHKSVYVHVAPQEDEVPKQKIILPKITPKKNYQIVFIKAPTPPPPAAPVIPPFPPQSDKTLIYVLHPKPEEAPPIHIPAPPQNAPVKPEVYFIKYKTKKEQEENNGFHHRRYGRDGFEDEGDEESLDVTDSTSATRSSALPESDADADAPLTTQAVENQYNESNEDASGESSNIIGRIYATPQRGGKNAH
ncbi:probable ATP-dependent RNA helicase ddx17 [Planococcus citri]|uniref:probable ATP-dependent RNA helicase ddx17 n=1 Tax=Planococcus citri TaxID=170843 RepID=UPI0031F78555